MSSVVDSDTLLAEKTGAESAKPGKAIHRMPVILQCSSLIGIGSRAASKVTFRDGDGKQQARSSAHPTEGEQRSSSYAPSFPAQHAGQLSALKKKESINPFKFSADVDFCALSQLDKREKAQVIHPARLCLALLLNFPGT